MKYLRTLFIVSLLAPLFILSSCANTNEAPVMHKHNANVQNNNTISSHGTMYGTEDPNDNSGIPQSILDGEE
ncbi:MAG: hypothetical protein EPN84_02360 [Legionella sp.]|nr:MAG: hypothetical protein EPN84_02360 [Legionella sp.]